MGLAPASRRASIVPFPAASAGWNAAHAPVPAQALPARAGRRGVLSIRWIIACTAVALITAAVVAVGAVAERSTRRALGHEIEGRLLSLARNLALAGSDALLSDFPELTLHPLALEMHRQPELALVVVLDRNRRVLGDPDPRRIGTTLLPDLRLRPVPPREPLRDGEQMLSDGTMLVASVPVTQRDGRRIGTAMVGLRLSYLDGVIAAARRQQTMALVVALALGAAVAAGVMSLLLRPIAALRAGIERIGRGELGTPVRTRDRTELGLLADAVNDMAAHLRRAQVELIERERLAHELDLARQIQTSLLPNRRRVAGAFVVQGSNHAAQEVGGDYFDFFPLSDGRIGLTIADVAGKGLAGCMVMSMLSALLRAYRDSAASPSALLATLDERLADTLQPGTFITMFYGVLDPMRGRLVYANAGHSPLLVYRHATARTETIRTRGIPLGAVRGGAIRRTLEDRTLEFEPGDLLLQFTDGVNEAFDPSGHEQFGFERLEHAVRESAPKGGASVLESVHQAVQAWVDGGPAMDDETMLVVAHEGLTSAARIGDPSAADPLELLARARAGGRRIEFSAQLQDLSTLRAWLAQDPGASGFEPAEFEVMCSALHEALANVAEHGYGCDPSRRFELWSLPPEPPDGGATPPVLAHGCFLIRDDGRPFRQDGWTPTDFADRETWKRGRGIGLDIIFRGARFVSYRPGTAQGNVTVLVFDPDHLREALKEKHHA